VAGPAVWVFINSDVLEQAGFAPGRLEVAKLWGFDVRSDRHGVHGVLVESTHAELRRLYDYAQDSQGGTYLPEAVLAQTAGGLWRPALCYLAPFMGEGPTTDEYIDRIVARLESFRPWLAGHRATAG
jgi:hypothetical protein